MAFKTLAKSTLGRLFQDYRINWIYAATGRSQSSEMPVPLTDNHRQILETSPTAKMRNSVSFSKSGLDGFVLEEGGRPVCVAHFADPARYDRNDTWPLRPGDIALMDIATEDSMRGRGLAVRLIAGTTDMFLSHGKERAVAFIWWSNTPSVRAFSKAGWQRIGLSIEFQTARKWRSIQLPLSV